MTQLSPSQIRDSDGKWINSQVFRQEAINFMKNKYYCPDLQGTIGYRKYWDEQLRRCIEGYEVGGWKITGHHYHYLNFTQIQIVVGDNTSESSTAVKATKNPDFWDGDFDYFWCLEIAKNGVGNPNSLLTTPEQKEWLKSLAFEERKIQWKVLVDRLKMKVVPHHDYLDGGHHMIVGKSRRKGYSFKNGAICANIYNTIRKSLTVIGAFDKKFLYPKGTMAMASDYLSFMNKNTAWTKARDYVDKQEHKKASFKETTAAGVPVEAGYQSEIMALSFKDNPDVARGKDALIVLFEEAGAFPNLKASYKATEPGLTAGRFITGQMLIFGTGGDMESGTVDFADMFYNPMEYNLMPFENIWDDNALGSYCGFFHPVYINMEGYYDDQGNSDTVGALAAEMAKRAQIIKVSSSTLSLQTRVQEYPVNPSEAFLTVSMNDFPIQELRNQMNKVKRENLHLRFGQPVHLERDNDTVAPNGQILKGKVRAVPDLDNMLNPIWELKPKAKDGKDTSAKDLRGAVVIYEYPITSPPKGLYKIGFDPYRQDTSGASNPSLGSIYVYKGNHKFSYTRDTIVAQYIGRPYNPDDVNRIAELLAELYNAEIMHENEVTHVKAYFEKKKKLHLLAAQPDAVISKNIKHSTVARTYGIHMNDKLKDAGEKYIKSWLLDIRDFNEHGEAITNLETIYDIGLLDSLIQYNRKGNFDRVMSFMMIMFQIEEEEESKVYDDSEKDVLAEELKTLMNTQFKQQHNGFQYN